MDYKYRFLRFINGMIGCGPNRSKSPVVPKLFGMLQPLGNSAITRL